MDAERAGDGFALLGSEGLRGARHGADREHVRDVGGGLESAPWGEPRRDRLGTGTLDVERRKQDPGPPLEVRVRGETLDREGQPL